MSYWAHHPLYTLGMLYLLALVVRMVFTWFPIEPGSTAARLYRWLYLATEPYLAPFRKLVPPMGSFDISFILAFIVLYVVSAYLLSLVSI
jgi:YggT family protein